MKKLLLFGAIALSTATFSQVPNYVPSNGLVGWWPFNGNANDESGNGNNGTVNGATLTSDRFGNINQAYSFDGVDDHISMSTMTNIPIGNNSRSISAWMNPTVLSTTWTWNAVAYGSGSTNNAFMFGLANALVVVQGWNTGYGAPLNYLTNEWVHAVCTFDGLNVQVYINGNLLGSGTLSGLNTTGTEFYFGIRPSMGVGYFPGKLDDIGIWDRVLTQCEIQDIYNSQLNSATGISAGTDQTVCEGNDVTLTGTGGSNYQWNNSVVDGTPFTPTATQNYIVTAEDGNGCIGTDTVNVEVLLNTTATQTESALDSYTWSVNNQTYTQSGVYTAVIPNEAGCDSTITLDLTMQFTGIEELIQSEKELVKIVDLMGRETPFKPNTPLIFIYSDGTRERVMKLEE